MALALKGNEIRDIGFLAEKIRKGKQTTVEVLQLIQLLEKTETGQHQVEELAQESGYESSQAFQEALQLKLTEEILGALVLIAVGILIGIGLVGMGLASSK